MKRPTAQNQLFVGNCFYAQQKDQASKQVALLDECRTRNPRVRLARSSGVGAHPD
jgi:hypothetical protein